MAWQTRTALLALVAIARPVHAQCADGSPPPCRSAPRPPAANTIAVLYFDNLSRDTADAYLADGFTEELISRLTQVEQLQVKSRTAVAALRGHPASDPATIGRSLGVAQLLNGSVLRSGRRLRVNVELTRASTGNSVWGRSFDRASNDLLGVQAEIAESIAVHVAGRLTTAQRRRVTEQPGRNPRAYDLLLKGRFSLNQHTTEGILAGIRALEAAYQMDSTLTTALILLSGAYNSLATLYYAPNIGFSRDSARALSDAYLTRAVERDSLAPGVAMLRAARVDPVLGVRWLESAVARDPRNAGLHFSYAVSLRVLGRDSAALAEFRKSLDLEADRPITLLNLGQAHLVARRYKDAVFWLDSAVTFRPDAPYTYSEQGFAHLLLGDTAGARAAADLAARHGGVEASDALLAMLDARAGDTTAALSRLAVVERALARSDCFLSHQCLELSLALANVGARERALALFERLQPRATWLLYWSGHPYFDPIRADPRFARIVDESRANMEDLRRSISR